MVDEFQRSTRKSRYEKKRTNTKAIGWLSIAGGILVVIIIALIVFGGNDNTATSSNSEDSIKIEEVEDEVGEESAEPSSPDEESSSERQLEVREKEEERDSLRMDQEMDEDQSRETISDPAEVESDDPNVATAYKDNWQPVGTSQSEPHTTNYNDGSQDREEMAIAVEQALGIAPENQITWWAGRAGDQAVEVTVSPDSNQDVTYRVHLEWIENEGWQPTLVEELKENDKN